MHMVSLAADGEGFHAVLAGDAAKIWPKPVANVGGKERTAFLGGEHAMYQAEIERVHGSVVPNGTYIVFCSVNPALKRLAIFKI